MTTTTQDTFKETLASNVSCRSTDALSIHGQAHLLDLTHPCLNLDEIVRLIVRELVTPRGKGAAVGLACCCKSFEDPVLDVLWATQDQLLPLLKTFPGDIWEEGGYSVSVPTSCAPLFP